MPDAALDQPVLVFTGELVGIGAGLQVRRAIGIPLHRDGRHGDDWEFGKPLFQGVELRLPLRETQPPTVVVNRDGYMIGMVEGGHAAIERGIVELPLRRGGFPDQLENSRRYFS